MTFRRTAGKQETRASAYSPMKIIRLVSAILVLCSLIGSGVFAQMSPSSYSGKRQKRIVIRNATVVDGSGKPAAGPFDIVVENDTITQIVSIDPVAVKSGEEKRPAVGDLEIDAAGKYVLPGLINIHAHTQDERGGKPQPVEYCMKMWLACGITTVRDVLASKKTLAWRAAERREHDRQLREYLLTE